MIDFDYAPGRVQAAAFLGDEIGDVSRSASARIGEAAFCAAASRAWRRSLFGIAKVHGPSSCGVIVTRAAYARRKSAAPH